MKKNKQLNIVIFLSILVMLISLCNRLYATKSSINNYNQEVLREIPLDIEDPFVISSDSDTFIPKNIFTAWHTSKLPPQMAQNVEYVRKINPEFTLYVFDNDNARNFIRKYFVDAVLNAYDSLIPEAYKSDLWRYCVLYKYGGIYQDIKLRPFKSFKYNVLLNENLFVRDRVEKYVYNAFIVSKSNNLLLAQAINRIIENVNKKNYGENGLDITGPALLGRIFKRKQILEFKAYHCNLKEDSFIHLNGKKILQKYPEYRAEQKKSGSKHYSELWEKRNVYRKPIKDD